MIKILYEDKNLLVCVKPVGLLSEASETKNNLPGTLKEENNKDVFSVHRLDRDVSGVIIYAKTKKAAGLLSQQISERLVIKEYIAVIHSRPENDSGTFEDLLFRDSAKNKTFVVDRMRKGVRDAKLDYEVISSTGDYSLVKIILHTGRTHQIRAQFSSRKMPLVGDVRYGSPEHCDIALFARRLAFNHPITNKPLEFSEKVPKDYPWNLFS